MMRHRRKRPNIKWEYLYFGIPGRRLLAGAITKLARYAFLSPETAETFPKIESPPPYKYCALTVSCKNLKCSLSFSISRITPPPTALPAMPTSRPPTSSSSPPARTRLLVTPRGGGAPPTPSPSTSKLVQTWKILYNKSSKIQRCVGL